MSLLSYSQILHSNYKHLKNEIFSKLHTEVRTSLFLPPKWKWNHHQSKWFTIRYALMYEMETRGNKSSVWGIIITGMQNMELKKFEVGKFEKKSLFWMRELCARTFPRNRHVTHDRGETQKPASRWSYKQWQETFDSDTGQSWTLPRKKFDNLKLLMSLKDVLRGFGVYWNLLRGEKSSRIKFCRYEKL